MAESEMAEWCCWASDFPDALEPLRSVRKPAIVVKDIEFNGRTYETIVACNGPWRAMCGFTAEEALGMSPKLLQGSGLSPKDQETARSFRRDAIEQGYAHATLVNYTKQRRPFVHSLAAVRIQDHTTGESCAHRPWQALA